VCNVGGAIKVSAGVAWTGNAVVLAKFRLVGAHGAADTPMGGGVVVVAGGAVHCGQGTRVLVGKVRGASPALEVRPTQSSRLSPLNDLPDLCSTRMG
jgi:hypothetical protein